MTEARAQGAGARLRDGDKYGHIRGVQARRMRRVVIQLQLRLAILVGVHLDQRDARVRQRRLRGTRPLTQLDARAKQGCCDGLTQDAEALSSPFVWGVQ